uniref:AP2/ERF domain-containing protein n=1 Tax=Hordeum vulgare subsp. vulgare TaxID=112509 RepID=A0A8I6Z0S0_HORVV
MCLATRLPITLSAALSRLCLPHRHRATMPPCRRGSSGFRDVRKCPSDTFYDEIRSGVRHLALGTFDPANEAARAYDAAAWRLVWPHRDMNFPEVMTRNFTEEHRRQNRRRERRVGIIEMDEHDGVASTVPAGRPRRACILHAREGTEEAGVSRLSRGQAFAEAGLTLQHRAEGSVDLDPDDERRVDAFITTDESDTIAS